MTAREWARPGHPPVALVLRALGLGDLLAGVPAIRGVRRALPHHHLVLATSAGLEPIVDLIGGIDELLLTTELSPLPVATGVVDVAIDLHGKGPLSQPVLSALEPKRLVAFGCAEVGVSGPTWHADEHEVQRWCRLVHESFGIEVDPADLRLARPPEAGPISAADRVPDSGPVVHAALVSDAIVIHPGAAFPSRRWPTRRWADVAAALAADGHLIALTGSAAEADRCHSVAQQAGLDATCVLAGRTDLSDLASLVSASRLVLSGDTGIAHLASGFGVASVVLFGPIPPRWWGPPTTGPHVALWHGDGIGDPWGSQPDPALMLIEADEVIAAARSQLARARAREDAA